MIAPAMVHGLSLTISDRVRRLHLLAVEVALDRSTPSRRRLPVSTNRSQYRLARPVAVERTVPARTGQGAGGGPVTHPAFHGGSSLLRRERCVHALPEVHMDLAFSLVNQVADEQVLPRQ